MAVDLDGANGSEPSSEEGPDPKPKTGAAAELATVYEAERVSEIEFPSAPTRRTPWLSLGEGSFCFLEDAGCRVSLLAFADVSAGRNVITRSEGIVEYPFTQYRVGGGLTVRPLSLASAKWHPWSLGATGSWSRGSGYPRTGAVPEPDDPTRLDHTDSLRVAVVNQFWLSQRRNAFHLDAALGAVKSTVQDYPNAYWGTHVELGFGFGGWGSLVVGSDFLDRDIRLLVGFRAHAIAAGPIAALGWLGSTAGGQR